MHIDFNEGQRLVLSGRCECGSGLHMLLVGDRYELGCRVYPEHDVSAPPKPPPPRTPKTAMYPMDQ